MKTKLLITFSLCFVITISFAQITVSNINFTKAVYQKYEKVEATFDINYTYANPYDPDLVAVDALITLPNSAIITVPCFYYTPCNYTSTNATQNLAQSKWMLRYTPSVTGNYIITIRVIDATGTFYSSGINRNVTTSNRKGFVKINPTNQQFMKFDNNDPYYPVGVNIAWNSQLITSYKQYFDSLSPNNINWTRYWLTDFARQALEWSSSHWSGWYSGLGVYSQRAAGILDSVLDMCSTRDIYMQLVLQHHGQFSTTVNAEWAGNPYNSANGGTLSSAGQFFSNAAAKAQTKKQYRYIIARWGYSTNVLAWELFNEVNFTDGTDSDIDSWHDEMSQYIQSIDLFDHIITTSSSKSQLLLMDNNPGLDMLQYHIYGSLMEELLYLQARDYQSSLTKPVMCGEFGTSTSYTNHPDNWGDHVRKSMWVGMFSEVPNMFWYWDAYIEAKNLYSVFKPLRSYLAGVDIVSETGGQYQELNFTNNITMPSTVTLSPGMSWGASTQNTFVVDSNGDAAGLINLSSYLQGSDKASMGREASFTVNFQSAGTAGISVNAASSWNAPQSLQVFIDGILTTSYSVPAAGGLFSAPVTAGTHIIRYYVSSIDWVNVNSYSFNPVSVNSLVGYGYTGNNKSYGYVYDASYGEWADLNAVNTSTGAILQIGPLSTGNYTVELWNPQSGITTIGNTYSTVSGNINVLLPGFKKDIAYKVFPATTTNINSFEQDDSNQVMVYPNPSNGIFTVVSDAKQFQISIFNTLDEIIYQSENHTGKFDIDLSAQAKGIYFMKIQSTSLVVTKKIVLTK
jgi:hypothetical protein